MADDRTMDIIRDVGTIHLEGNIIPHLWFENLKHKDGKPNVVAIMVLSEIVYWYRPKYERDERTGKILAVSKRFHADKLQLSYETIASRFGFTYRQARTAIDFLKEDGVITTERRKLLRPNGLPPINNVLYLEINPARLRQLCMPSDIQVTVFDTYVTRSLPVCQTYTETTYTETTTENGDTSADVDVPAEAVTQPTKNVTKPRTPKATKERDPNIDHPAVQAYTRIMSLNTNKAQRILIVEANPDLKAWERALLEWSANAKWNPKNIPGILDFYSKNHKPRVTLLPPRTEDVHYMPPEQIAALYRQHRQHWQTVPPQAVA